MSIAYYLKMRSVVLCSLAAATSLGVPAAQEPDQSAAPTFGTTVVLPGGLRGAVYFVLKDTTVLPDFERDEVQRIGEVWTDALNILPRHWRSGFPGLTERFEWFAIATMVAFGLTSLDVIPSR
jgi:hypothetical protein